MDTNRWRGAVLRKRLLYSYSPDRLAADQCALKCGDIACESVYMYEYSSELEVHRCESSSNLRKAASESYAPTLRNRRRPEAEAERRTGYVVGAGGRASECRVVAGRRALRRLRDGRCLLEALRQLRSLRRLRRRRGHRERVRRGGRRGNQRARRQKPCNSVHLVHSVCAYSTLLYLSYPLSAIRSGAHANQDPHPHPHPHPRARSFLLVSSPTRYRERNVLVP